MGYTGPTQGTRIKGGIARDDVFDVQHSLSTGNKGIVVAGRRSQTSLPRSWKGGKWWGKRTYLGGDCLSEPKNEGIKGR